MSSTELLFLSGDYEAQEMCRHKNHIQLFLIKHFLYSILISSLVNMPVGCYYQSKYTQFLVNQYKAFYFPYKNHPPVAELSIGDDRCSFAEDVEIKKSWFPKKYNYTDNDTNSLLTKNLKNIQPRIRNGKMRKKLTSNISADVSENSPVHAVLSQILESEKRAVEFVQPLKKVIEVQEYAILPPYIEIEMERHGLSTQYAHRRWLDFILFKAYSQSCEDVYQCYCNNPLRIFYDDDFKRIHPYHLDYRDTNLFEVFIHIFPFHRIEHIEHLSISKLMEIKYSSEFQHYLYIYQTLIEILRDELQVVLLENNGYVSTQRIFQEYRDIEFHRCKHELLYNTQDAITLYKILKNPFTKSKRFKEWISHKTDLPALYLLSCVKSHKYGILKEYLCEIFQQSKHIYQEQRRKSMKNFSFAIGKNQIEQEIKTFSDPSDLADNEKNFPIKQAEFQKIPSENLEIFKKELFKNTEINTACRKAILAVLDARYVTSEAEYEKNLKDWKKSKKAFSQKVQDAISLAANIASIGAFIEQLMLL